MAESSDVEARPDGDAEKTLTVDDVTGTQTPTNDTAQTCVDDSYDVTSADTVSSDVCTQLGPQSQVSICICHCHSSMFSIQFQFISVAGSRPMTQTVIQLNIY